MFGYNKINNQIFWKAIPADKFDENKHGFRLSSVEENTSNFVCVVAKCISFTKSSSRVDIPVLPLPPLFCCFTLFRAPLFIYPCNVTVMITDSRCIVSSMS